MTTTVSELVIRQRFEDQVSAGAQAATQSLERLGDAADTSAERISRAQQRIAAQRASMATGPDPGADWLAALESGAGLAQQGVERLGGQFAPLTEAMGKAREAAGGLTTAIRGGGGLLPVLGSLAAAAAAVYAVYQNWDAINNAVTAGLRLLNEQLSTTARLTAEQQRASEMAQDALRKYAEFTETAEERTRRLANEQREAVRTTLQLAAAQAQRNISGFQLQINAGAPGTPAVDMGAGLGMGYQLPATPEQEAAWQRDMGARRAAAEAELARLQQALDRLGVISGGGAEYGPPTPPGFGDRDRGGGGGRSGPRNDDAWSATIERIRREQDERERARRGYEEDVRLYEAQARALGMGSVERERYLAWEREMSRIRQQRDSDGRPIDPSSPDSIARASAAADAASAKAAFDRYAEGYREIEQLGTRAFDRIGDAITRAFATGEMKSLDFGNIAKGVLSEIAQTALRLAVVNPLTNALLGTNRATIFDAGVSSALFGGGGGISVNGSGAFFSGPGVYGNRSAGAMPVQSGGGFMDAAGSVGEIGYRAAGGNSLFGGGAIGGFINQPLYTSPFGYGASSAPGVYGPVAAGGTEVTIGQALGGVAGLAAGGYGIYTGLQAGGAQGYTQAAAGGVAAAGGLAKLLGGAAAGGIIGNVATFAPYVAAALAVAAMLMPKKEVNAGGLVTVTEAGGVFEVNGARGKHINLGEIESDLRRQLEQTNQLLRRAGIYVDNQINASTQDGIVGAVGYGPAASGAPRSAGELYAARIGWLRSDNPQVEQALRSGRVNSFEEIIGAADWVKNVYDPLMKLGEAASDFKTRMDNLTRTFDEAIAAAQELGINESDLVAKRAEAVADLRDENRIASLSLHASTRSRLMAARGNNLGASLVQFDDRTAAERRALIEEIRATNRDPESAWGMARLREFDQAASLERAGVVTQTRNNLSDILLTNSAALRRLRGDDRGASLLEFDRGALREREALEATLRGASIREGSSTWVSALTTLEEKLAEQRLEVIRRFTGEAVRYERAGFEAREAAAAQAGNVVVSLSDYARQLATGSQSTGTAMTRYRAAARDFEGLARQAIGGDLESISRFQSYADAYLGTAREAYGSGAGYARAFDRVTEVLARISQVTPDTLTRSAFAQETRSANQILVEEMQKLRAAVEKLQVNQAQAARAPARVA